MSLGFIIGDNFSRNFIFKLHSTDNGFDPALSAEPYTARSCGAVIEVSALVAVLLYQLLYMGGMDGKWDNHGLNINYFHLDLTDFP